jgi:hypothetical protein
LFDETAPVRKIQLLAIELAFTKALEFTLVCSGKSAFPVARSAMAWDELDIDYPCAFELRTGTFNDMVKRAVPSLWRNNRGATMPQAFSPQMLRRPVGHHHDRKDIGGELLEFGLTEHVVELVVSVASCILGPWNRFTRLSKAAHLFARCNYGANLVCGKANVSREPAGATAFCKENPGSDSVPMAATGHDTIYSWECAGNKARISGQTLTVDPRGFIAENWKRIKQ